MSSTNSGLSSALDEIMGTPAVEEISDKPTKRKEKEKTLQQYKGRTCTVACRLPIAERDRLSSLFQKKEGKTLAAGLKDALYEYAEKRGWNE